MKKMTFTQTNKPVGISEVSNAETILGVVFPNSYREFLLKYNGGLSKEGIFNIPNYGQSSIIFLGINTGEKFSDIVLNYQAYKKRLPENVIPIGFDPGGNLICLVSIRNDWNIYFWDHETENTPPEITNMFHIADSFSEFIDSLQEEDNGIWGTIKKAKQIDGVGLQNRWARSRLIPVSPIKTPRSWGVLRFTGG